MNRATAGRASSSARRRNSRRSLADDLRVALARIDVLADNAGGAVRSTRPTVDGNEPNYQINALVPFLLTTLLTPVLEGSGRGWSPPPAAPTVVPG